MSLTGGLLSTITARPFVLTNFANINPSPARGTFDGVLVLRLAAG